MESILIWETVSALIQTTTKCLVQYSNVPRNLSMMHLNKTQYLYRGDNFCGDGNYLNRFTIYSKHQYDLILELCTIIDHYGSPYKKYKPIKYNWSRHRVLHFEDKHTDSPFVEYWSYRTHKWFSSYIHTYIHTYIIHYNKCPYIKYILIKLLTLLQQK
jgi:hypothetical protein